MQGRGNRHDHGVDARVREKIAVVEMELAAGSRRELLALGPIPTADRDEGGVPQVLGDVTGVAGPVLAEADEPDAEQRLTPS